MHDKFWHYFWPVCLLISGGLFTAVTLLVLVRGGRELAQMLKRNDHD